MMRSPTKSLQPQIKGNCFCLTSRDLLMKFMNSKQFLEQIYQIVFK